MSADPGTRPSRLPGWMRSNNAWRNAMAVGNFLLVGVVGFAVCRYDANVTDPPDVRTPAVAVVQAVGQHGATPLERRRCRGMRPARHGVPDANADACSDPAAGPKANDPSRRTCRPTTRRRSCKRSATLTACPHSIDADVVQTASDSGRNTNGLIADNGSNLQVGDTWIVIVGQPTDPAIVERITETLARAGGQGVVNVQAAQAEGGVPWLSQPVTVALIVAAALAL